MIFLGAIKQKTWDNHHIKCNVAINSDKFVKRDYKTLQLKLNNFTCTLRFCFSKNPAVTHVLCFCKICFLNLTWSDIIISKKASSLLVFTADFSTNWIHSK